MCNADKNPKILTSQNQHDFGTNLSVQIHENAIGSHFEITIPPDDPKLTGIRKFTLVIGTVENTNPDELYAQLHTGSKTDGSKFTQLSHFS